MKLRKRMLSLALVLALILGLCPGAVAASGGYTDVSENHWAYPYIQDVTERGVMNGVASNLFQPDGTMTRAMFVTVLARMSGETLYPDEPSVFPRRAHWKVLQRCGELGNRAPDRNGLPGRNLRHRPAGDPGAGGHLPGPLCQSDGTDSGGGAGAGGVYGPGRHPQLRQRCGRRL